MFIVCYSNVFSNLPDVLNPAVERLRIVLWVRYAMDGLTDRTKISDVTINNKVKSSSKSNFIGIWSSELTIGLFIGCLVSCLS